MTTMSIVQRALSEGTRASEETLSELRSTPILELVEGCQESLTSTDDRIVSIALYILGRATQDRPSAEQLNKAAVVTLTQFFGVKARRYGTCDAAVDALSTMFQSVRLSAVPGTVALLEDEDVVQAVLTEVLPHVHAQSLLLNTRKKWYELFTTLVRHDTTLALLARLAGSRFLKSFLATVDGERDPTLLLDAFGMHARITGAFPPEALSFLVEDMFESLTAYFPVLFTPPPGCKVTRQALKTSLATAMRAPVYHELCPTFLCGKLCSPSSSSKQDSLEILCTLFGTTSPYTNDMLLPHVPEVLTTLRSETLKLNAHQERSPEAQDILRHCLKAVTLVARAVAAQSATMDRSMLLSTLEPILGGAVSTIETDTASGRSYATLLHAIGRANASIVVAVSAYLLPLVASLMHNPSSPNMATRRIENCFSCVGGLLSALEEVCATSPNRQQTVNMLTNPKDFVSKSVLDAIRAALTATIAHESAPYVLRVASESLATWCALGKYCGPYWLSETEASDTFSLLFKRAFASDVDQETSEALLAAIGNATRVDPDSFSRACCPLLPTVLCNEAFLLSIRTLASASRVSCVAERLIDVLLNDCLERMMHHADEVWGSRDKHNQDEAFFELVAWLVALCDSTAVQKHSKRWVQASLATVSGAHAFNFATQLFSGYSHEEQLEALRGVQERVAEVCRQDSDPTNTTHVAVFDKMILCGVSAEVMTDVVTIASAFALANNVLNELLGAGAAERLARGSGSCVNLRCMEALVNKVPFSPMNNSELLEWFDRSSLRNQPIWFCVAASMTKGLLGRGAKELGDSWCARILTAIDTEPSDDVAGGAVRAIGSILAQPRPSVSTVLWEQRFFMSCVQHLTKEEVLPSTGSAANIPRRTAALTSLAKAKPSHLASAGASILTFLERSSAAHGVSSADVFWGPTAELLCEIQKSGMDVVGVPRRCLSPSIELVLMRDTFFTGVCGILAASSAAPMSSKRAVLYLLKATALEIEALRATAEDDDDSDGAGGAENKRVVQRTGGSAASLDEVLGAARGREKAISNALRAALSHPKRLVRKDAADGRHIWSRVLK